MDRYWCGVERGFRAKERERGEEEKKRTNLTRA
jgi:hypothetical protein